MIAVSISCQGPQSCWHSGRREKKAVSCDNESAGSVCLPLRTENGKWNDHSCIFFYYINANLVYLLKMCYTVYYYIVFKFNNNHNALLKYTCVPEWSRLLTQKSKFGGNALRTALSSHQASSSVSLQSCASVQFFASEFCMIRIGGLRSREAAHVTSIMTCNIFRE